MTVFDHFVVDHKVFLPLNSLTSTKIRLSTSDFLAVLLDYRSFGNGSILLFWAFC